MSKARTPAAVYDTAERPERIEDGDEKPKGPLPTVMTQDRPHEYGKINDIPSPHATAIGVMPIAIVPEKPMTMLAHMVSLGHKADELTKMMDLCERWRAMEAEAAFNEDMAECQKAMPTMVCDSFNKQTNSPYISLHGLNKQAKPVYTKYGFSLLFGEGDSKFEGHRRITLDIGHVKGHSKPIYLDIPLDGVGIKGNANMTAIHGRLSADTYAMIRLIRHAFNITVADDDTDTDGNGELTQDQIERINTLMDELRATYKDFSIFDKWWKEKWIPFVADDDKAEKLMDIPVSRFDFAVKDLEVNIAKRRKS